ncbi:MAG TPA: sulfur carrier protein ThiS [Steroidobacteraceae bacterium]|jgi:sulfur carrier protein|nr:sulfur carrier protein ThiS [Steroidobacteraceae bacterium]
MRILVNGVWRETAGRELAAALEELGYGSRLVSTAVNGEFVSLEERACTALADGDRLEVLAPMQGG